MAEIKAVLFDLGGTLRVSEKTPEYVRRAWEKMCYLAGETDVDAFTARVEANYKRYRKAVIDSWVEADDYRFTHEWLLPELPEEKAREICYAIAFQIRQTNGLRRVVDGCHQLIMELKRRGYKLALISNLNGEIEVDHWLKEDGLEPYFDAVVLSSVCCLRKPDPRMYQLAFDELGVTPEECAYVGDNPDRDIVGSRAAGIAVNILSLAASKHKDVPFNDQNRPDYVCDTLLDILKIPELQGVKG